VACRVRIRLSTDKTVETSALVNSGFESDDPDVVIPVELARKLNLWPPHPNSELTELGTGGGDVIAPYYAAAALLELISEGKTLKKLKVNIIVNPHVDEVILSDAVAGELGIVLLDLKRGLWRLNYEAPDVVRPSSEKEEWR
jgi:hypothetical protein